jgi:ankyrin repeat protein
MFSPMTPDVGRTLRIMFYVGFSLEIAAILGIFLAGGFAGFLLLPVILLGFVISLIGSFAKPRSGTALLVMLLHAPFFSYLVVWDKGIEPWLQRRAYQEGNRQYWERRHQREHLARLIEAGNLEDAKAFLRQDLPLLRLGAEPPWTTALCPPDGRPPDLELLQLMSERGAPHGGTLLVKAARCSLTTVQAVLELGIAPTARSAQGYTGLMTATDIEVLQFFLDHGVKVDARSNTGATALMFHRTREVTRWLLAHGADPKAIDKYGRSALHYKYQGAREQLAPCFELILDAGADPNLPCAICRYTPLHALVADHDDENADRHWVQDAADLLVERGADPLARDCSSETPLSIRVQAHSTITASLQWPTLKLDDVGGAHLLIATLRARQFGTFRELLDAGANPLAEDFDGSRPLDYYEAHIHDERASDTDYKHMVEAARRFRTTSDAGL